jgi:hypothetical protein
MKRGGFLNCMPGRKPPREDTFENWKPKPRPVPKSVVTITAFEPTEPAKAKRSKSATAAEKAHMGRVAALGCILCGQPAEVHHLRDGQGMAQRASNWLVIPACPDHHRGPRGIHGDRSALKQANVTEIDLLAMTIERLAKETA